MNFKRLTTKDTKEVQKMDDRHMKYMYYYNDIKNEWYYEDEILHIGSSKIITEK